MLGVALAPAVLLGISLVVAAIRVAAPGLHNVPTNPMGALMRDPALAAVFAFVVVVAGGMREELQRGFQLHRLTGHVCGPLAAVVLTSLAFGAGHSLQGWDVAVATGILGAGWALLYLTRHSIVAAAVSHGLFNLAQVVVAATTRRRLAALERGSGLGTGGSRYDRIVPLRRRRTRTSSWLVHRSTMRQMRQRDPGPVPSPEPLVPSP